jgi:hypothetical protein
MSAQGSKALFGWGDRTELLPKEMGYVLSLYLRVQVNDRYLTVVPQKRALHHLFKDTVVTMPEGLRCDLPVGDLASGAGEIGSPDDPSSVALQLRLRAMLHGGENLLLDCVGVVNFAGGLSAFRSSPAKSLVGSAFISTRHETESPTYRWFTRRQLFGIGRVRGVGSAPKELDFSFDLYASASAV